MYKISAIICSCNRHELLNNALKSLLEQTMPRNTYEIIIIDNSTDKHAAAAFQNKLSVEDGIIYHYESTPGLSLARNIAVDKARADIVAFMDDDAVAHPEWLEKILEGFKWAGDRVAVVGGKVLPKWEVEPPSWLLGESYDPDTGEYFNHRRPLIGNLSIVNWGGNAIRSICDGEWLAGVNIAFRKELVVQNGGFDAFLGRNGASMSLLSNEESNLMKQIMALGYECLYAPHAIVTHYIPCERISQSWLLKRVAWQVVSDIFSNGLEYEQDSDDCLDKIKNLFSVGSEVQNGILDTLFSETTSPDIFEKQIHALVSILKLALFDPRPTKHA